MMQIEDREASGESRLFEDCRLLGRYADNGDQEAFRVLVSRYLDFVYTVCLREALDRQMAEDACQETFIALAKQARSLRRETNLPGWLFAVATRKARDLSRREFRERRKVIDAPAVVPDFEAGVALQQALKGLAAGEREAVVLRVLMDYSYREVAESLGVSEDAARMRTERALKRLRERAAAAVMVGWKPVSAPVEAGHFAIPMNAPFNFQWLIPLAIVVAGSPILFNRKVRRMVEGVFTGPPAAVVVPPTKTSDVAKPLVPIYAKVEIKIEGEPGFTGETWRTAESVRWRQSAPQGIIEAEVREGTLRSMTVGVTPGASEGAIILAKPERRIVETDLLEAALFQLPVYLVSKPPLSAIPLPAPKPKPVSVTEGGRRYKVWFEGERASKVEYEFEKHRFITTVTGWQEVEGVKLPAELKRESWFDGAATPIRTILIKDVKRSGITLPEMPTPTKGALVMDERRRVIYRVDESWKRISEEQTVGDGDGLTASPNSPRR